MSRIHKGVEWPIRELRDQSSLRWKPNGGIRREMQTRECTAEYKQGLQEDCTLAGSKTWSLRAVNNSLANLYRCFNVTMIHLKQEMYLSSIYILILYLLLKEILDVL